MTYQVWRNKVKFNQLKWVQDTGNSLNVYHPYYGLPCKLTDLPSMRSILRWKLNEQSEVAHVSSMTNGHWASYAPGTMIRSWDYPCIAGVTEKEEPYHVGNYAYHMLFQGTPSSKEVRRNRLASLNIIYS